VVAHSHPAAGTSPLPPPMPSSLACTSSAPSMPQRLSWSGYFRPASGPPYPASWPQILCLCWDEEGGRGCGPAAAFNVLCISSALPRCRPSPSSILSQQFLAQSPGLITRSLPLLPRPTQNPPSSASPQLKTLTAQPV
jgi:hypothetical protein